MRVVFGPYGGEPQPTRIAVTPCHRFQRAGINSLAVTSLRFLGHPFTSWWGGRCTDVAAVTETKSSYIGSRPTFIQLNHLKLIALHRSLLRKRCANSPAPWNVAPRSRKWTSNRSPARSTKVRPPRSTSRAVPGDVKNPKSSAHEPTSRPVNLTVMRSSRRIIESISTISVIASELPK